MKIAVVGSREGWGTQEEVCSFLDVVKANLSRWVPMPQTFERLVTGDSRGIDTYARRWGLSRGVQVDVHLANWKLYGRGAGPMRNLKIVTASDWLIAFWDGASPGTFDSLNKALTLHNRYPLVVLPDGTEYFYTQIGQTKPEDDPKGRVP